MRWLKRIILFILLLVLLLVVISLFLPKQLHMERSAIIQAPPATVYGILNNLKSYDKWMPWNQIDPNWNVTYSPKTVGTGASYHWVSKSSDVGTGTLTIVDSKPYEQVITELAFEGMGNSLAGWKLTLAQSATNISWYIDMDMSKSGFFSGVMGKWMGATGLMNKLLGKQFENGLDNLKKLAEGPEASQFTPAQ